MRIYKFDSQQIATSFCNRKGSCWDNAVPESFFKTVKMEIPVGVGGCCIQNEQRQHGKSNQSGCLLIGYPKSLYIFVYQYVYVMAIIETTSRQFRERQKDFFDMADKGQKVVIKRGNKQAYVLTPVSGMIYISLPIWFSV